MRRRNRPIMIWLTEEEYTELKARVARTPLSMQAYLRDVIRNIQPKERIQYDLFETLKLLQNISINLNQLARKANSLNFIDTAAYWKLADEIESTKGKLLEIMYGD